MAHHSKHNAPTLRSLSKRQWIRISTAMASVGLVVAGVVATQSMYSRAEAQPTPSATAYSITESNHAASRGNAREAMDGDTSYVTVKVNGQVPRRARPGLHRREVCARRPATSRWSRAIR